MSGWIKLHRKILDWELWPGNLKRPFTETEAWLWMLLNASHKDTEVNGVELKAGQIPISVRQMAVVFGWSRGKVRRFLHTLESQKQADHQTAHQTAHLTICNWATYQQERPTNRPEIGPPHIISRRKNKELREPLTRFKTYLTENKETIMQDFAHYDFTMVKLELCNMIDWLTPTSDWTATDYAKRNKRSWGRFIANWLKRSDRDLTTPTTIEETQQVNARWSRLWIGTNFVGMTVEEEERNEASKRRSGTSSGFSSVGDLVSGIIKQGEK